MSQSLSQLRQEIHEIDEQILLLLAKRRGLSTKVWQIKQQTQQSVLVANVWQEKIQKLQAEAVKLNIPTDLISKIWDPIHLDSINLQQ